MLDIPHRKVSLVLLKLVLVAAAHAVDAVAANARVANRVAAATNPGARRANSRNAMVAAAVVN